MKVATTLLVIVCVLLAGQAYAAAPLCNLQVIERAKIALVVLRIFAELKLRSNHLPSFQKSENFKICAPILSGNQLPKGSRLR